MAGAPFDLSTLSLTVDALPQMYLPVPKNAPVRVVFPGGRRQSLAWTMTETAAVVYGANRVDAIEFAVDIVLPGMLKFGEGNWKEILKAYESVLYNRGNIDVKVCGAADVCNAKTDL